MKLKDEEEGARQVKAEQTQKDLKINKKITKT